MVYTDNVHMIADSVEELHNFAVQIGLKRHFYHGLRRGHPHYDLTNETIKQKAISAGASVVTSRWIVQFFDI